MRRDMEFKNLLYMNMLDDMKLINQDGIIPFGVIHKMWCDGAFDEYSDNHFLIHAFNDDAEYFRRFFENHYIHITYASEQYTSIDCFPGTYVVNLENSFRALVSVFGYDNIRRFVTDQLSAGKECYDEEIFFEALSEIHILSFFCQYGGMAPVAKEPLEWDEKGFYKWIAEPVGIVSGEYEPTLNGNTNPEARFCYEDGTILDIEIKTPFFKDTLDGKRPFIMPGLLVDADGRSLLKETCENAGIQCLLPNVSKMKDYLNSAAKKFQEPENKKHINLLCINWSGAVVDKDYITEPLIILANSTNGILTNPAIAQECQISKKALNKVSAVLLYKLELGALLFSDFRFIFADGEAKVILNSFSNHLNVDAIYRITKLSCIYPDASHITSTVYANDICWRDFAEEISEIEKNITDHILS